MEHLFIANQKATFTGFIMTESITDTAFPLIGRGWF
jgi:hypothetical protein